MNFIIGFQLLGMMASFYKQKPKEDSWHGCSLHSGLDPSSPMR